MKLIRRIALYLVSSFFVVAAIVFVVRNINQIDTYVVRSGSKLQHEKQVQKIEFDFSSQGVEESEVENVQENIEDNVEAIEEISDSEDGVVDNDNAEEVDGDDVLEKLPFFEMNFSSNSIKIGFITDMHLLGRTSDDQRKYSKTQLERINYFVEKMNNVFHPRFILINGDAIEGTGLSFEDGQKDLEKVKSVMDRTDIEKYWVVGNHDLRAMTKEQWESVLNIDHVHESFDVGDYRIIILDSNFRPEEKDVSPGHGYTRGMISKKEEEWLEDKLETSKRKIVFMHHPAIGDYGTLRNTEELNDIFSKNDVLAVFSGHTEDLMNVEIEGVKYFSLPGTKKRGKYKGAFAEITVTGSSVRVNLRYLGEDGLYTGKTIK